MSTKLRIKMAMDISFAKMCWSCSLAISSMSIFFFMALGTSNATISAASFSGSIGVMSLKVASGPSLPSVNNCSTKWVLRLTPLMTLCRAVFLSSLFCDFSATSACVLIAASGVLNSWAASDAKRLFLSMVYRICKKRLFISETRGLNSCGEPMVLMGSRWVAARSVSAFESCVI